MLKRALIILVVVVLLAAGGYYGWGRLQETVKIDPPQLVTVRRDVFVHEILGRGSVDSARNQEVRVRVESAGQGGLTIVYVIEEGSLVKEGDLLVELESAWLEEQTERQQTTVISSESRLIQSKADLENAKLMLKEYVEGTLLQERKTIENEIFSAEERVRTQGDQVFYNERLFDRGYITKAQFDAAVIEYETAKKALEIAEIKLDRLENFTSKRMITQYETSVATAEKTVEADEQTHLINTNRLRHLQRQLANCQIFAPSDGQVVYHMPRWGGEENLIREGKRVIDKEILLLLPDPTQMQVKGLINEANVRHIKIGQRATIRLEAFMNETFEGEVTHVNSFPEATGFGPAGSMSREYLTTIKILNSPEGVKTGLTAEARIVVNEIPNALLLPKQAVFTHGRNTYAITFNEGKWDKVEVVVGPSNDREVVIREGLSEGDEVVLGAWVHRDKVDLPKIDEEVRQESESDEEELFLMRQEARMQQQQEGGGRQEGGQREGGSRTPGGGPPGGGPRF